MEVGDHCFDFLFWLSALGYVGANANACVCVEEADTHAFIGERNTRQPH